MDFSQVVPMCPRFEIDGWTHTAEVNGQIKAVCEFGFNEHLVCDACKRFVHRLRGIQVYPYYEAPDTMPMDERNKLPSIQRLSVCADCYTVRTKA